MGLIDAFLVQCDKTPDNIAVKYENQSITYRQLDDMSNALAQHTKNKGVAVDDNVIIVMDRGIELMIAIYVLYVFIGVLAVDLLSFIIYVIIYGLPM